MKSRLFHASATAPAAAAIAVSIYALWNDDLLSIRKEQGKEGSGDGKISNENIRFDYSKDLHAGYHHQQQHGLRSLCLASIEAILNNSRSFSKLLRPIDSSSHHVFAESINSNNNNSNNRSSSGDEIKPSPILIGDNGGNHDSKRPVVRKHFEFVIFGSGTAAHAALEAIRQLKPQAEVLMITDEVAFPRPDVELSESFRKLSRNNRYNHLSTNARPYVSIMHDKKHHFIHPQQHHSQTSEAVTAELLLFDVYNEWRRHVSGRLSIEDSSDVDSNPLTLMLAKKQMKIDLENRIISSDDGTEVQYDKCLLAPSGKPRGLYVLESDKIALAHTEIINNLHNVVDFEMLANVAKDASQHITILGGGFLGTEIVTSIAAARQKNPDGPNISHVFVEETVLHQYLPRYLSEYITNRLRELGISMKADRLVTGVNASSLSNIGLDASLLYRYPSGAKQQGHPDSASLPKKPAHSLELNLVGEEQETIHTDYVVLASTKLVPQTHLVHGKGIEIDANNGGIVTNASLEVNNGFFVAGNLASYYDLSLGR